MRTKKSNIFRHTTPRRQHAAQILHSKIESPSNVGLPVGEIKDGYRGEANEEHETRPRP
jgi:hypothetical protein